MSFLFIEKKYALHTGFQHILSYFCGFNEQLE